MLHQLRSGSNLVVDGAIVRATGIPSSLQDAMLGQDAITTELVLGMPQGAFPGMRILGRVNVPSQHFRYPVFRGEHLFRRNTQRGLKERIGTSGLKPEYQTGVLGRFAHATDFDDDEISENASGDVAGVLRLAQRGSWLARQVVELDLEYRRHALLTTATNYPVGNRLAISGGSEWDAAGGDAKADIETVGDAVIAGSPFRFGDLTVFMAYDAFRAALKDPVFIAYRQQGGVSDQADEAVLARYYGVKEVWTEKPVISTSDSLADTADMYSDLAIVYISPETSSPGGAPQLSELAGQMRFGAAFGMNDGVALRPYYDEGATTWYYPWQQRELPALVWNRFGGIITNCVA